jgi:hypothetical protein
MNYETNDMYLSGFIIASGIPLLSHERDDAGNTVFCFEQTDKLNELVESYYNMNATINPNRYGASLKMLKNVIYRSDNMYKANDKPRISHNNRKVN